MGAVHWRPRYTLDGVEHPANGATLREVTDAVAAMSADELEAIDAVS